MGAAKVLRYRDVEVPRQTGEVGRLRVLKGPNQGMVFVLTSSSIVIGRGDECDVMLGDLKASRKHAKMEYTKEGWVVTDLGSANGIFSQGQFVRKVHLSSTQHFSVGDTILEFFASSEGTQILMSPFRPAGEVIQMDQAMGNQRAKVLHLSQPVKVAASKKKTNPLLILGVVVGGAYMFQDDLMDILGLKPAPVVRPQEKKAEDESKLLASFLPPEAISREVGKTAEQYYRQGFREFREGNYLRAKSQYELALQVNPNHQLARKGLENAEHSIDGEVKRMMNGAEKAVIAGRLREAKGYYETAMRLLYFDRSNPDYVECEEAAKKLNEELMKGY